MQVGQFDGFAEQFGDAYTFAGHGGEERHAEPAAQFFDVKPALAFLELIEHVQCACDGDIPFL